MDSIGALLFLWGSVERDSMVYLIHQVIHPPVKAKVEGLEDFVVVGFDGEDDVAETAGKVVGEFLAE